MSAVQESLYYFHFISESLRCDKEFFANLVGEDWTTLEYASVALKEDEQLILAAIKNLRLVVELIIRELKLQSYLVYSN
jgi:Domain of unknown function (DUF4116)